jgi:hypothetical protein
MTRFLVGEVATFRSTTRRPAYSGMDCEIVRGLHLRESSAHPGSQFVRYLVRAADGKQFAVSPDSLRKKPRKLEPDMAAWCEVLDLIDRVKSPAFAHK